MTLTNETKIGALATVSIALLILGFNFLKGKNLFERKKDIYAIFPKVDGLSSSDAVRINGFQVGKVTTIKETDQDLSGVVVGIQITKNIHIPKDSYAVISANPLGSTVINIVKGKQAEFITEGDTLRTIFAAGLIEELKSSLSPTMDKVNGTLASLDSLIEITGSTMDASTRSNLQQTIQNLQASTAALNAMLAAQSSLNKTLSNVQSITANIKNDKDTINRMLANAEKFTANMAALDMNGTMDRLQKTADQLNSTLSKINSGEGSLGQLMNDKKLYNHLTASANSLNVLLQDFRLHPKRYVSISVFGGKNKTAPLMKPLEDSVKQ